MCIGSLSSRQRGTRPSHDAVPPDEQRGLLCTDVIRMPVLPSPRSTRVPPNLSSSLTFPSLYFSRSFLRTLTSLVLGWVAISPLSVANTLHHRYMFRSIAMRLYYLHPRPSFHWHGTTSDGKVVLEAKNANAAGFTGLCIPITFTVIPIFQNRPDSYELCHLRLAHNITVLLHWAHR